MAQLGTLTHKRMPPTKARNSIEIGSMVSLGSLL